MPARPRPLALLSFVLALFACKAAFDTPPVEQPLTIGYPPGVDGDLPTNAVGATVAVQVLVTDHLGRPQAGVVVAWDGQVVPPPVYPAMTATDPDGLASAVWELRAYPGLQTVRAYLPGAEGNPVEYRVQTVSLPPPPQNPGL